MSFIMNSFYEEFITPFLKAGFLVFLSERGQD